jgi:hypothetical protein
MKTSFLLSALAVLLLFSCSSNPPGSEYIGTWGMRDSNTEITISKSDGHFTLAGIPELNGTYVLNDKGHLIDEAGKGLLIDYNKENNVIVVSGPPWPISTCFDKRSDTGQAQSRVDSLLADSAAKAKNIPDGLVGQWKTSYPYYAYTVTVTLDITKTGSSSCPDYTCTWKARDQFGGKQGDYTWCAKCDENHLLIGITNLGIDNTKISIYKEDEQGTMLTTIVEYPGKPQAWDLTFTH